MLTDLGWIGALKERDQRMTAVKALYDSGREQGLSYADIARFTGLTRNQVAADIRDSREPSLVVEEERPLFSIEPPRQPVGELLDQVPISKVPWNVGFYDIEVMSFGSEGYAGNLICACLLDARTGKLYTVKLNHDENHGDDRRIMNEFYELMGNYQILIGHYIAGFDYNWLLSRAVFHRMPPPPFHHYIDTFHQAKGMLKTSKGLGNLIDYLRVAGAEKTAIRLTEWSGIRSPNKETFDAVMNNIVYHCQQDVIANQKVFDRLYPYMISRKGAGSVIKDAKFMGSGVFA